MKILKRFREKFNDYYDEVDDEKPLTTITMSEAQKLREQRNDEWEKQLADR